MPRRLRLHKRLTIDLGDDAGGNGAGTTDEKVAGPCIGERHRLQPFHLDPVRELNHSRPRDSIPFSIVERRRIHFYLPCHILRRQSGLLQQGNICIGTRQGSLSGMAVRSVPADYFRQLMSSRFGYAAAGSVRVGVARPDLCGHW